jgi:ribosomal protein S18 acetylase RimI-like enzyme
VARLRGVERTSLSWPVNGRSWTAAASASSRLAGVPIEITQASLERLDPLASVFGRSFVVEPMMLWSVGDHGDLAERYTLHFRHSLETLLPLEMVWEVGSGDGAAIWFPPGGADAWQQVQMGDEQVDGMTPDGARRYAAFWEWIESRMANDPVWHLDAVAVDPAARGRGIGAALIEHGLALARADGLAAVLETGNPRNVSYYERFGFRVVDEADAPDGGPRIWFLRRDP